MMSQEKGFDQLMSAKENNTNSVTLMT